MNECPKPIRPTPRWVRTAGIATVLLCVTLLALGGFVTTFRVGMADPVWPTEPWYLLFNYNVNPGYLIEHTHRIFGWLTGAAVIVFTFGAWLGEPDRKLKLVGLVTFIGLIVAYGEFHRGMGVVWNEVQEIAKAQNRLDPKSEHFAEQLVETGLIQQVTKWPVPQALGTAMFAVGVLFFGAAAASKRTAGGWVRCLANIGLVCVMAQGLLGGFRVFLNALAGTNLAAIHGVFGQVTFAVLVAGMVLCQPRRAGDAIPESDSAPLARLAWISVTVLFMQLVWAVWVRHHGSAVAQRLHILTAFVATGFLVWLSARILLNPIAKPVFRGIAVHLLVILGTQVALGVESYIGKFAAAGPQAQKLPEDRTTTEQQAGIRTAHQLIGAGLLAATVAAGIRLGRRPVAAGYPDPETKEKTVESPRWNAVP
jgi:cytochrome c oxidase assembly protein subunit 15